jgi:hypothetical protein
MIRSFRVAALRKKYTATPGFRIPFSFDDTLRSRLRTS